MIYRSFADLSNLIRKNINKIPHDIDLVVGIPRSGMLPANLVALYLNKRFTDIDSFIEGRILSSGERKQYIQDSHIKKVLVVDDSVDSGRAINKAKKQLEPLNEKFEFLYFAPIVTESGMEMVDIFLEVLDTMRIFEWNFYHHSFLSQACMDIDGVLNVDPEVDDDGPIYSNYILNATPLHIPTVRVDTLISCRLEKYRPQTEKWLREHNVSYNNLVLLDMPDKATRVAWNKHGEYKGLYYKKHKNILFVESSLAQAIEIAKISHKDVFCVETNSMIEPDFRLPDITPASLKQKLKRKIKKSFPFLIDVVRKFKSCIK